MFFKAKTVCDYCGCKTKCIGFPAKVGDSVVHICAACLTQAQAWLAERWGWGKTRGVGLAVKLTVGKPRGANGKDLRK